jgi:hypothetical protein
MAAQTGEEKGTDMELEHEFPRQDQTCQFRRADQPQFYASFPRPRRPARLGCDEERMDPVR